MKESLFKEHLKVSNNNNEPEHKKYDYVLGSVFPSRKMQQEVEKVLEAIRKDDEKEER